MPLCLAFPDDEQSPTHDGERSFITLIASNIGGEFCGPKIRPGF